jgi:hypothetical protein
MEPDILSIEPPVHVQEKCPNDSIEIEFFFGLVAEECTVMEFDVKMTANKIAEEVFLYFSTTKLTSGSADDWVLKVCGHEQYVLGDYNILCFRHIQWYVHPQFQTHLVVGTVCCQ